MTRQEAWKLRAAMVAGASSLSDQVASTAPDMFQRLRQDGAPVPVGTRINWGGTVKRAAVDLWDREDQDPDHAPTLWEDLDFVDGVRRIPDPVTFGTAFALGELGWWNGVVYRSKLANNTWTPVAYPDAWEVV